uniref:Uncharacterized protein n=1 Tax=Haptolina ericina TaxID=156174 RepID=A0A7S3BCI2_9EUKA
MNAASTQNPAIMLSVLLDSLNDPAASKPSRATTEAALLLCEELTNRLRSLLDPDISSRQSVGKGSSGGQPEADLRGHEPGSSSSTEIEAVESSETSGSSALLAPADPVARTKARQGPSRPSARQRRKQSRQAMQAMQAHQTQAQHTQLAIQEDHFSLLEQQQFEFEQAMWRGGWQMMPRAPTVYPAVAPPRAEFQQYMWNCGWQMVPITPGRITPVTVRNLAPGPADSTAGLATLQPEAADVDGAAQNAAASNAEQVDLSAQSAPVPEQLDLSLRERFRRCLKVYRWQRMQSVWTKWMATQE